MSLFLGVALTELPDIVLARLGATGETVLDNEVKATPPGRYVVFYDEAPRLRPSGTGGDFRRQSWTFRTVCVGRDAGETRHVVRLVHALLVGWRPRPTDSATGAIVPVADGAPILRDDSVPGDIRFSQTLTWRVASSRRS